MNSIQRNCQFYGTIAVGSVVAVVVAPIVSTIALPFLAIKAAVHGYYLNYHWRMSKDEKGSALLNDLDKNNQPKYMSMATKFKVEDLTRLQHEEERIYEQDQLFETVKLIRGAAKAIIPVFGVIWVLFTETGANGASSIGHDCCSGLLEAHSVHWTPAEAIKYHIKNNGCA